MSPESQNPIHESPNPISREQQQQLLHAAQAARLCAYAPYSNFLVGAALRTRQGDMVIGANVENCSYGLTICAERTAIATAAITGMRPGDLQCMAIVAAAPERIVAPCGACRQVLAEFAPPHAIIMMHNLHNGQTVISTIAELMPHAFLPAHIAMHNPTESSDSP